MHSSIVGLGKAMQRLAIAKGHGVSCRKASSTAAPEPPGSGHFTGDAPATCGRSSGSCVTRGSPSTRYGQLAVDLYDLARPDTSARAHLAWARDFHARPKKTPEQAVVGQSEMGEHDHLSRSARHPEPAAEQCEP